MKVDTRLLIGLKLAIYCLWPASAWATKTVLAEQQVTLATSLMAVPNIAWLMVFILSTVSGLASLLNALKSSTPEKPVTFVLAHMLGCWLSGFLVFLVAENSEVVDLLETVGIALGSYGGAKLTEKASETLLKKVSPPSV